MRKLSEISRHESSLPNKFVGGIKVISAVTTPDFFAEERRPPSTLFYMEVIQKLL